jgi:hypothetical protein
LQRRRGLIAYTTLSFIKARVQTATLCTSWYLTIVADSRNMPQHTFIVVTDRQRTRREIELQSATARSHAAKASWKHPATSTQKSTRKNLKLDRPSGNKQQQRKQKPLEQVETSAEYEEDVEEIERVSTPSTTRAWQWIKGTSADDFEIIPGSNKGIAPFALEFCGSCSFLCIPI